MTVAGVTWSTHAEGLVSVHAADGTYGSSRAGSIASESARTIDELVALLDPTENQSSQPVDIYLLDDPEQLVHAAAPEAQAVLEAATRGEVVALVCRPDVEVEPVASQLTKLLVARWYGPDSSSALPVVPGLVGLVAGRTGAGPSASDADAFVLANSPDASTEASATSFVAYLLRSRGAEPLRAYLSAYDSSRREQAALTAYGEPLAALENSWLESLHGGISTSVAARKLARQLLPRLRESWRRELEVLGYTILDTGLAVALPLLTGAFVNEIVDGNQDAILPYSLLLVGIFLLMTPIAIRRAYASAMLSQNIVLGMQRDVFSRLLLLPHSFHASASTGDLLTRLGTDTERVRGAMETVLRSAIFTVVKGVVAAVVLFFISPALTLLAVLTVPLFWLGYLALRSRLENASTQAQTLFGEVATTANESLSAQAVIKAYGLEERTESEYESRLQAFFAAVRRLVTVGSALDASTGAAMTVSQLVVLLAGGYLVSTEQLQVGFLFTFMATVPMLFEGSMAVAGIGKTIEEASGSMDRVLEVLEAPLEIEERPDAVELPPFGDEIRFEGVTFAYEEQPVLHDFHLVIPAGASVAIVGPSGCGKTTVVNLLMRFWDPQEGRVTVGGHDLRSVTLDSLRDQIAIVFQDTFVFDTTVRENIALARPGATDAEVEAAARAAQLESYVAGLANGFDTVVGERGIRMSGGQRQRLAIARALLRNPAILILDEATSALDAQTESQIQRTIADVAETRTTISITHRLRTAARADRIVVLDAGRIVAEGTHDELLTGGGLYRRLYDEQSAQIEDGVERRVDR